MSDYTETPDSRPHQEVIESKLTQALKYDIRVFETIDTVARYGNFDHSDSLLNFDFSSLVRRIHREDLKKSERNNLIVDRIIPAFERHRIAILDNYKKTL